MTTSRGAGSGAASGSGSGSGTGTGSGAGSGFRFLFFSLITILSGVMVDILGFRHNITVSSINCNSLNCSISSKQNQNLKINGITKLGSDIILLGDIRLSNKNLTSCADEVKKLFLVNMFDAYELIYNSSLNKRGVGILVNKKLCFSLQNIINDQEENFLLAKLLIQGECIVIGSVYGPNSQNLAFFTVLKEKIREISNNMELPVLLGGDWNCTYSADPVEVNIDVLNMRALPNAQHSVMVNEMCVDLNLVDPYRELHYDKVDFTFTPRSEALRNKSRIDFFLVSERLLRNISSCSIADSLPNKLFDHKAISIELNKPKLPAVKRPFVSNNILSSELLDLVVKSTVAETYIQHTLDLNQYDKDTALRRIGQIKMLILNLGVDYRYRPGYCPTLQEAIEREHLLQRGNYLVELINIQWLETLNLSVEPDIFLEVLVNNIRNDATSFQSYLFKEKNKNTKETRAELKVLKANYADNTYKIRKLESNLNDLADSELRCELENYAWFEHVNAEKMSPKFLDIAKKTRSEKKIEEIKDSTGTDFPNSTSRNSFVRDYFRNIYKNTDETVQPYEGCINDFLGPDICNNPTVRNCKLTEPQREEMELPFTLAELDAALEGMNNNSAGGPDGLSVKFVKKFWCVLRVPLIKYSHFCIDRGRLTQSFLTASIRLIPKKGDCSNIKNWRPISLLNVLYKILSKALNNRLKLISGTILTRSQKGFVENRYIQECLINIIESVNYSNKNNIPAFCLALDQTKAFDSVNHVFMEEVYKFFGFGPTFTKMVTTLTTGRNACIILDDGNLSEPFPLEGGHTQGNGPSPLLFNFSQQILLFKIEFHPSILSIFPPRMPEDNNMVRPERDERDRALEAADEAATPPAPQGNRQIKDDKVEAFADDASVLARASREAGLAIKNILIEFHRISGLQCNFEKSTIMFFGTGTGTDPPEWANELGFAIVESTKVLGCEISCTLSNLDDNFNKMILNVRNIKNFWSRFNLSLPGRIGIAKNLMLSQIGYLGCMLTPNEQQLQSLYSLIGDFIKGKLIIGKDKLFIPVEKGGLGMIDVKLYIKSLQCAWLKRLQNGMEDTYKSLLSANGFRDVSCIRPCLMRNAGTKILSGISANIEDFYGIFLKQNLNWKSSPVLSNPLIKLSPRGGCVEENFLRHNIPPIGPDQISNLKLADVWDGGGGGV
jgi:exonuclease III